jgi:DNA end-binding protein Ku
LRAIDWVLSAPVAIAGAGESDGRKLISARRECPSARKEDIVARPIWRGSLSFGLVAIPVQLHTAVREHRPKFRLLHAKDKSPIKYERVCQRDGTPVAWEDLVKGYEYERGRYVVLTKDDFKAAAIEKDRRVQVSDFVPAEAIDDRYFDQPYYLLPDKGGEHAYAVFLQALKETGRVGIGKVVLRERQRLVAVESIENRLVLTMMRFNDEVVDAPEVADVERVRIPAREAKLATDLINALASDWEPEKYVDDYQVNLQEVIKGKLKGETVVLEDDEAPMRAEVVDLAERLRASLKAAGARKVSKATMTRRPAKTTRAAASRGRKKRAA